MACVDHRPTWSCCQDGMLGRHSVISLYSQTAGGLSRCEKCIHFKRGSSFAGVCIIVKMSKIL